MKETLKTRMDQERIEGHLSAVLGSEAELGAVEKIVQKIPLDKIVRFLEILLKVFKSFGWVDGAKSVGGQAGGDAAKAA